MTKKDADKKKSSTAKKYNTENLIPLKAGTKRAKEISAMGGRAAAEARRQRRSMQETAKLLMSLKLENKPDANLQKVASLAGMKGKNITAGEQIVYAQVKRALEGDINAAYFIRDLAGEKPTEKVEHVNANAGMLGEISAQLFGDGAKDE